MTGMRSEKKVNCLVTGWFVFLSVLVPNPITVCARQYLPVIGINFNLWNFYFWYTYCVNLILCFINCFPFYSTTLILQSSCLLPENRLLQPFKVLLPLLPRFPWRMILSFEFHSTFSIVFLQQGTSHDRSSWRCLQPWIIAHVVTCELAELETRILSR